MSDLCPEHEKLVKVQAQSRAIGEFLESSMYVLATWDEETGDLELANASTEKILADHFGIDLVKLEEEKNRMLSELRERHERSGWATEKMEGNHSNDKHTRPDFYGQ